MSTEVDLDANAVYGGYTVLEMYWPQPLVITGPNSTINDTVRFLTHENYNLSGVTNWSLFIFETSIVSYDDFTNGNNLTETLYLTFEFVIENTITIMTKHVYEEGTIFYGSSIYDGAPIVSKYGRTHPIDISLSSAGAVVILDGDVMVDVLYATTVDPPRGIVRYESNDIPSNVSFYAERIGGYPTTMLEQIEYGGVNHTFGYDFSPMMTFQGAPSMHATTTTASVRANVLNPNRLDSRVETYLRLLPQLSLDSLRIKVGSIDVVPLYCGATPLGLYDTLLSRPARYVGGEKLDSEEGVSCDDVVMIESAWYCIGPGPSVYNSTGEIIPFVNLRFGVCDGRIRLFQSGPIDAVVVCIDKSGLLVQSFDLFSVQQSVWTQTLDFPLTIVASVSNTTLYGVNTTGDGAMYSISSTGVLAMDMYGMPRISYDNSDDIYFSIRWATTWLQEGFKTKVCVFKANANTVPTHVSDFNQTILNTTTSDSVVDVVYTQSPTGQRIPGFTLGGYPTGAYDLVVLTTLTPKRPRSTFRGEVQRCYVASSTELECDSSDACQSMPDCVPGASVVSGPLVLSTDDAHSRATSVFNLRIHLNASLGLVIGGNSAYGQHVTQTLPHGRIFGYGVTSSSTMYGFLIMNGTKFYRYEVENCAVSDLPTVAAYLAMYPGANITCSTPVVTDESPYLNGTIDSSMLSDGTLLNLSSGVFIDNTLTIRDEYNIPYHEKGTTSTLYDPTAFYRRTFNRNMYCPSVYSQYPLSTPVSSIAMEFSLQSIHDYPLCTLALTNANITLLPWEDVPVEPTTMHIGFDVYDVYVPPPPPTCDMSTHHYPCEPNTICTSYQYESKSPNINDDRECTTLLSCILGYTYETTAPTTTSDRECSRVSGCGSGEHVHVGATLTSDTVCRTVEYTCAPGEYVNMSARNDAAPGSVNNASFCETCTAPNTTWNVNCEVGPCVAEHSSITCSSVPENYTCNANHWLDAPSTVVGWIGHYCRRARTCIFEKTPLTRTSDRVCDPFGGGNSSSDATAIVDNTESNQDGAVCPPGFYKNPEGPQGPICEPFTHCLFIRKEGTPHHDRECAVLGTEEYVYHIILGTIGSIILIICASVWIEA